MGNSRVWRDPGLLLAGLVRLLDVALIVLGGVLIGILHPQTTDSYPVMVMGVGMLAYILFPSLGVYRSWRGGGLFELLGRVSLAWGLTLLIALAILYVIDYAPLISPWWWLYWAMVSAIALALLRVVLYGLLRYLRRRGLNLRRIVLIGTDSGAKNLLERVSHATWSGYEVIDHIIIPDSSQIHDPQAPPLQRLLKHVAARQVEEVWITAPLRDEHLVRLVMDTLRHHAVNVRYAPDIFSLRLLNHSVSEVLGVPMLELSATPMTGLNRLIKALEDRLLALLILIGISPLLLLIALAVKLTSPGPILFKQVRHGWDGRQIRIYKFRSMYLHHEPEGRITQATRRDPRITPIGAMLRRTSLDELPQFFNVLQGRMSIVGPRPHALCHNEQYKHQIDHYMLRHRVKPGITGWAQVNGYRGETDTLEKMQRRVEYDLYYIEHWSLWFDLKIIFLTVKHGFINPNAY